MKRALNPMSATILRTLRPGPLDTHGLQKRLRLENAKMRKYLARLVNYGLIDRDRPSKPNQPTVWALTDEGYAWLK